MIYAGSNITGFTDPAPFTGALVCLRAVDDHGARWESCLVWVPG